MLATDLSLFARFGLAMTIGFLIGLQRERAHGITGEILAGERTFALLSLTGAMAAMLSDQQDTPWILAMVVFAAAALSIIGYFTDAWRSEHVGITTEVAILVAVMIGALCYWGYLTLAAATGIATTVVLSIKLETDRFVKALTHEEVGAALQLAVISAIVLPLLPNESFGPPPFDVLNPFNIWLMVVFISAINFLGYIMVKIAGPKQGVGMAGILGGLASSTAVTLSFSKRSQTEKGFSKPFALAIMAAWVVMFIRVLIEVGLLNLPLLKVVWLPIAAAGVVTLLYSYYLYRTQHEVGASDVEISNPLDLVSALRFGVLYAVVLFVSRAALLNYGDTGLFFSSILSGLVAVNPITLSMAELSRTGELALGTASQAIVLAAMSNTIVKGGIIFMSGSVGLRKVIWPGLVLVVLTGVGVAFWL